MTYLSGIVSLGRLYLSVLTPCSSELARGTYVKHVDTCSPSAPCKATNSTELLTGIPGGVHELLDDIALVVISNTGISATAISFPV